MFKRLLLLSFLLTSFNSMVLAERIKDLVSISGVRTNQLVGYGLVVGLSGTGDKTSSYTEQSFKSMLESFGITIPESTTLSLGNVAAVVIHAELPPFSKPGQQIDVTVSSIGNAKSLRGGSLLMVPLKGADGNIYAIAQGNLVVGGFGVSGKDGSSITVNIPSAGRIPNGATVERVVPSSFNMGNSITLNLYQNDFTTAKRVADAVNKLMGPGVAAPVDAMSIQVAAPKDIAQRVRFLSLIENIEVIPAEALAKVVVNSRTGTIVIGNAVRVAPSAITHGSLTVTISENQEVSQPGPLAQAGNTEVVDQSQVEINQDKNPMFVFKPGASLEELVKAVNKVGATPADLMAILEALKQAGSLKAHLEVI